MELPLKDFISCFILPRFEQAPVTLSGGLKDDATGAHCFLFLRRRGKVCSLTLTRLAGVSWLFKSCLVSYTCHSINNHIILIMTMLMEIDSI